MNAVPFKHLSRLLAELAVLLGLYLLGCQLAAWLAWLKDKPRPRVSSETASSFFMLAFLSIVFIVGFESRTADTRHPSSEHVDQRLTCKNR